MHLKMEVSRVAMHQFYYLEKYLNLSCNKFLCLFFNDYFICVVLKVDISFAQSNADYMFGGVTAVCGILGSLAGGFILDRMTSTISNAFKVSLHSEIVHIISL